MANTIDDKITIEENPARKAARTILNEGYKLATIQGYEISGIDQLNREGIGIVKPAPTANPSGLALLADLFVSLVAIPVSILAGSDDEPPFPRGQFIGVLYTNHPRKNISPSQWELHVMGRDYANPLCALMEQIRRQHTDVPPIKVKLVRDNPMHAKYLMYDNYLDSDNDEIMNELCEEI